MLVVRGTKVTEPMLDAGPVKLVVRAGAGYNTIDVAAASKRGIYVSNCPGKIRSPLPSSPCPDSRARSSHRGQRSRLATRHVEQEGVFQSAWFVWTDAWSDRRRQNRAGDDSSGACVWHAGGCVEQEFDTRAQSCVELDVLGESGCCCFRRCQCSSGAQARDKKPDQR